MLHQECLPKLRIDSAMSPGVNAELLECVCFDSRAMKTLASAVILPGRHTPADSPRP